jgi:hypothetical protein
VANFDTLYGAVLQSAGLVNEPLDLAAQFERVEAGFRTRAVGRIEFQVKEHARRGTEQGFTIADFEFLDTAEVDGL